MGLRLLIQTERNTTEASALASAMLDIVIKFQSPTGITAKQTVVQLMEATCMIPGIFTLQMLSWRHRLQDLVHKLDHVPGRYSLQYKLLLSSDLARNLPQTKTVSVQTTLSNPNGHEITEFKHSDFQLQWVLTPW